MRGRIQRLRTKVRQLILITSGIALLMTSIVYFIFEYNTFRHSQKQHLTTLAKIIASNSSAPLAFFDPNNATEILNASQVETHVRKACIYDMHGRNFTKFPPDISVTVFPPMIK